MRPVPRSAHRRFPRFAVTALIAATALWVAGPAVDAQAPLTVSVDQVGWWSDRPIAPPAGEGGFEVASGSDAEPQSIAAFQVTIPATQVDTFALTFTQIAGFGAEFGTLAICRSEDAWAPADPGDLDDAPVADCSTRVYLTPVLEERTWIGDVATLVADGGTVTLMVVPEYAPPVPVGPGMVVRIGEIDIEATGSSAPVTTTSTTLDFDTPGGSNQFDQSPDSGFTAGPAPVDIGPDAGSFDLAPVESEAEPSEQTPTSSVTDTGDDAFFTLEPEEASASAGPPWLRLLLLIPLSVGIGLGSARLRQLVGERDVALSTQPVA